VGSTTTVTLVVTADFAVSVSPGRINRRQEFTYCDGHSEPRIFRHGKFEREWLAAENHSQL
jgi:hypothetical protein